MFPRLLSGRQPKLRPPPGKGLIWETRWDQKSFTKGIYTNGGHRTKEKIPRGGFDGTTEQTGSTG